MRVLGFSTLTETDTHTNTLTHTNTKILVIYASCWLMPFRPCSIETDDLSYSSKQGCRGRAAGRERVRPEAATLLQTTFQALMDG